ncbi:hypothetical protein [Pseudomonas sp. 31 R 17]|nr:hypothetical protein [Pseudomonas sp. 31 R 17]
MMYHYYYFVFHNIEHDGNFTYHSSYMWIDEQKVTTSVIEEARRTAQASSRAILLNCSYLGRMTEAEFDS